MNSTDRSTMEKHQLAQLPDLVWPTIFKFLDLDDLLNLKMVFGELKQLMSLYVESKKVVINQGNTRYLQSPFISSYLVGKSLVRLRLNQDMHVCLKKLVLFNPLTLFNLTGFDNLTDLTVKSNSGCSFRWSNPVIFRLKNLERFSLRPQVDSISIILETPKLSFLGIESELAEAKILYPRSIRTLDCMRIRQIVKQMTNLEILDTLHFSIRETGDLLKSLKGLKKFIFYKRDSDRDATNGYLQSARLENPNLSIYYKRIDFNSNPLQDDDLEETSDQRLDDDNFAIYQRFIDSVDDCLNHSTLEIRDFESLSVELIRKVTLLESLHVLGAISDNAKWVELLKLSKTTNFTIKSAAEEDQLRLIPEHCPFVTVLEVASFQGGDWVLRLRWLKEFKTDLMFDFELFKRMIKELRDLKLIRLTESHQIKIDDAAVECLSGKVVVLREPKFVFLQTVQLVSCWGDLFNFELDK